MVNTPRIIDPVGLAGSRHPYPTKEVKNHITWHPTCVMFHGIDTAGKTELARLLLGLGIDILDTKSGMKYLSSLFATDPSALLGAFAGSTAQAVANKISTNASFSLDPYNPIPVLARMRAEWILIWGDEPLWMEKLPIQLTQSIIDKGYNILSINLTSTPEVLALNLEQRQLDFLKRSKWDKKILDDPILRKTYSDLLTAGISKFEKPNINNPNILCLRYETSNDFHNWLKFNSDEVIYFLRNAVEYFGNNSLQIICAPIEPQIDHTENIAWHTIYHADDDTRWSFDKETAWTLPLRQKDGNWYATLAVDIEDFRRESRSFRLKPFGWEIGRMDTTPTEWLARRASVKLRNAYGNILANPEMTTQNGIIVPRWDTSDTKLLHMHTTILWDDAMDILPTCRYGQIFEIPLQNIVSTWSKSSDTDTEWYIKWNWHKLRLANGVYETALMFAKKHNLYSIQ